MLISEAELHLQPYGVERIERIPSDTCPDLWRVTVNISGIIRADYIYACPLERIVWALTPEED